jgi:crossover junction endodeoxyribonuclease RusA
VAIVKIPRTNDEDPEPQTITAVLPYPISANRYWKPNRHGRMYKTQEARDYQSVIAWRFREGNVEPLDGDLSVTAYFYRKNLRSDLDNGFKVLLDALEGYAYHNDNQVAHIQAFRCLDRKNPRLEIKITTEIPDAEYYRFYDDKIRSHSVRTTHQG